MNDTTFENYQKRMLDAIKNSNEQSNDPFTKLSNILENLKLFVNTGIYSQAEFKQEVEKQFKSVDSSDETARHFKKTLKNFCSTKNEAIKTISELHSMVKPISTQVGSWSAVASIANECMADYLKIILFFQNISLLS